MAVGDAREALDLLDRVLAAARSARRDGSLVEARMVRALAHHAHGDADSAAGDLAAALNSGVPAGWCQLFLDEGRPLTGRRRRGAEAAANARKGGRSRVAARRRA